ncbi:5'-methylthioadenosine/S-adenosylhomocysteine nucleosidase [Treponema sp.]|uniref:5'-methylthioadenosine/S-adenosylhomocysteine nucleosidase n=1 Tax=Treponema sp. TaxID=166 RepID=UPI00298DE0D2|nr:5'-methylthioadenosine/S-adenosylhomocysteine nucleosidase [Treponema sp.]MCQ2241360.1 5'-methylthioadenosine/S-adenosylhomocysteine nucleosidase [Treponema sp.]
MSNSNFPSSIKSILIFGAMNVETEYMVSKLSDVKKTEIGGYPFFEGNFSGKKIIVCRTFTGMENSAAATAIGILNFSPDCIISQGTAGGHDPLLHKKDIVIGERLVNISSFKTNRYGKGEGIHPTEWEIKDWDLFEGDEKEKDVPCLYSNSSLVDLAMATEYKNGNLVKGTISSSNNWNMEMDRINHLVETYGSTCEEMESYAATQIANRFNIPSLTIRIISNSEQHPGEEYERTTGQLCQEFVLDVVKKL